MKKTNGLKPFDGQNNNLFDSELDPFIPYKDMTHTYIMKVKTKPDKIVRVSYREWTHPKRADDLADQLKLGDRLLDRLSQTYGINVVDHSHVVDDSPNDPARLIAYTIVDLVEGVSLDTELEKTHPSVTQTDLELLLRSLISYHFSIWQNGGQYLSDISRSLSNYMYGNTSQDSKHKIYLIDIDTIMREFTKKNPTEKQSRDLYRSIGTLAKCITKSEQLTGWDLAQIKNEYLEKLNIIPTSSEFYRFIDKITI